MDKPRVKVVVIGNGGVGKTSMLITYLFGKFPSVYIPTSIEDGPFDYMVDGQAIIAGFWDTAGGVSSWTLQWRHNGHDCTQPVIQAQIKENIKAPRYWPLWWEFTGDRWIPRTKGQ